MAVEVGDYARIVGRMKMEGDVVEVRDNKVTVDVAGMRVTVRAAAVVVAARPQSGQKGGRRGRG